MSRRYGDQVDVRRGDRAPDQFLWRGRLYLVRTVLAHWLEAGAWWRSAAAAAVLGTGGDAGPAGPAGGSSTGGLADAEIEYWRVEASPGRMAGVGVYDLCFDWSSATWSVARVLD